MGMNETKVRFWGGLLLILLSTLILFSSLTLSTRLSALVLVVVVAGLAAGSLLVGFSRRGRAV